MELDFKKEKDRFANMSDAELLARVRDPDASSNDRMLAEAEISRRGIDRRAPPPPVQNTPIPVKRSGINPVSLIVIVAIVIGIVAGILEDMGIDVVQWLREFFSDSG